MTSPSLVGSGGVQGLPDLAACGLEVLVMAPEAALQAGDAVAHGEGAVVGLAEGDGGGRGVGVDVLVDAVEHVLPIAGERDLQQQPGEAAAGFDDRDQAPAGDVEPLEQSLVEVDGLVDEPVIGQLAQLGVVGQHEVGVALAAEHPRSEVLLVGAQPQDKVVEGAGERERPVVDTVVEDGSRVCGRGVRKGPGQ